MFLALFYSLVLVLSCCVVSRFLALVLWIILENNIINLGYYSGSLFS